MEAAHGGGFVSMRTSYAVQGTFHRCTTEPGIQNMRLDEGNMQKLITWEPGNGTRYELTMVKLTIPSQGYVPGTWVVIGPWPGRPRIMFIPPFGGMVSHSTIEDKFGVGPHDASVVALMIAPHVGMKAMTIDNLFEHYPGAPRNEPTVIQVDGT